ncbi:hypothetical protein ACFQPA_18885 [Halomarina halobia]|uniref:Uncharacterized protein n=1 Tax=Halomarina halobia TaxID=3033386 RepID=A0ABD6ADI3_9EURY|nr:hypothetical protein [Halomarina sp. PSR21]
MIPLLAVPLHGGGASPIGPYPHWLVLIAAVIGVWLLTAGGVPTVDVVLSTVLERRE